MAENSNLKEVISYPWNVDSSQRSAGTNASPTFNTSQVLSLTAKGSAFQIYFTSIQVPFTFYQFSNIVITALTNLPLSAQLYDGTTAKSIILALPQGNYSAYSIITMLNTVISAAWAANGLAGTPTFTTSYSVSTGFMTFSMAATGVAATSYVNLDFTGNGSAYYYMAGFFGLNKAAPPNNVLMTAAGGVYTSTFPCVLNPINYLLVRSNLKQLRSREFITSQDTVGNVLVKIPITTQQQSWINYFQLTEPIFLIDNLISSITFTLTTNLSSNAINLQGVNWSFSFIIREVIRPDYESILTTTANNFQGIPPDQMEERQRLLEERQKILSKLEMYQEKLTPQPGAVKNRQAKERPDVLLYPKGQTSGNIQPQTPQPISGRDDKGQSKNQGQG